MPPRMALRALTLKIKLAVKTAGIIKMGSVSFFFDNHVAHVPDHVGNQGGHAGFHSL